MEKNLTPVETRVLAAVARNGPAALAVHRSMARIGKPPQVNAVVRRLEKRGLVHIDQALNLNNGFMQRWYRITPAGVQYLEDGLREGALVGKIA